MKYPSEICYTVTKIAETPNSTASALSLHGEFLCFLIEDGYRENKEWGSTRIPAGVYELRPRQWGKFFDRYRNRYGHWFVPEISNVPGFTAILAHQGNTVRDTAGCLLPNMGITLDHSSGLYYGTRSAVAYQRWIDSLSPLFTNNTRVLIDVGR